ncbi:MAG: hypothetical protein KDJ68_06280 [Rhodobiaceae bacterium]|nr:hypothetical protein [Rhodobiaceae bacterium]
MIRMAIAAAGLVFFTMGHAPTTYADEAVCSAQKTKPDCEAQSGCVWVEKEGQAPYCAPKSKVLFGG